MAIRDYWVYQKRDTPSPWALYIVKEYDKRIGKEATVLDFTLYSEDIGNPTHSISHVGIHCDTIGEYVCELCAKMEEFVEIVEQDERQLYTAIEDVLYH